MGIRSLAHRVISGILFAPWPLSACSIPFVIWPRLIFDGRSIVVSIAGFIGGWCTALIAALINIAYMVKVAKFMRASLSAAIEIKLTFSAKADLIIVDLTKIHQALMNLCTNAALL